MSKPVNVSSKTEESEGMQRGKEARAMVCAWKAQLDANEAMDLVNGLRAAGRTWDNAGMGDSARKAERFAAFFANAKYVEVGKTD